MNRFTLINDLLVPADQASIHVSDLALQRGYGIFDFFKVINGCPVFLDNHLDRFYRSAARMRLQPVIPEDILREKIAELIAANSLKQSGVRITLTGGYSPDGYTIGHPNLVVTEQPLNNLPTSIQEQGISLITFPYQRQLPDVKTIDYLMAVWLQDKIIEAQASDVLYHYDDCITECPRANIFMVTSSNVLITPANNILKGVTRHRVLEIAAGEMKVEERDIYKEEIYEAKEVFITSTTKHLMPVKLIDGKIIGNGTAGETTRSLCNKYNQSVYGK